MRGVVHCFTGNAEEARASGLATRFVDDAALDNVIQHEGVTLTEACRRLIGYGDFVYRQAKQEKATILVRTDEGTREVVLV